MREDRLVTPQRKDSGNHRQQKIRLFAAFEIQTILSMEDGWRAVVRVGVSEWSYTLHREKVIGRFGVG